jgi:hypothetical protein
MMAKITNKQVRSAVESRTEFSNKTGSLYGGWPYPGVYAVNSYGPWWPLLVYVEAETQWYVNVTHHSATTNLHRKAAYPRSEKPIIELTLSEIDSLLDGFHAADCDARNARNAARGEA